MCVHAAPGCLHVVVILVLIKEFYPPPPSPHLTLPVSNVRMGAAEKDEGKGAKMEAVGEGRILVEQKLF